jgi:hypothetical protein
MTLPVPNAPPGATPSLDALAGDPALVCSLTREHAIRLLPVLAALLEAVRSYAYAPAMPATPKPTASGRPRGRWITLDEAVQRASLNRRRLMRIWPRLGFGAKDGKRVVLHEQRFEAWLDAGCPLDPTP